MYSDIAIGQDPEGNNYYLTDKQIRALNLLKDNVTLFTGYGGSARCCKPNTYVNTINGYVQIKDISVGDLVLSFDSETGILDYKRVLNVYRYEIDKEIIKINNELSLTNEHKVLFRGEWTEIAVLRERIVEANRRKLLHIEHGQISDIKPSKFRETKFNETGFGRKWLFENNDTRKREVQDNQNAQGSNESVCSQSVELSNRQPQEFRQNRQSGGKYGVDEPKAERNTRLSERTSWKLVEKRRKTASELLKDWFKQWRGEIGRTESQGNKGEIHSKNIYPKNVGRGIWSKSIYDSRRYFKALEARELTEKEILNSKIVHYSGEVYDLEVEDYHSYCVTDQNIIVHNSGKSLLECFWIIFECLAYPGVGYGLARKELSVLRKTVLITLFNLLNHYRLKDGDDYKYHEQKNKITFKNGSEIFLIDTAYQPSDPLYTRFGGLELTGCAIDESNESDIDAIGTLFSRCGWRKNEVFGINKKMLETFNPDHSHVYKRYYAPYRDKVEPEHRRFIPALPGDNPHPAAQSWIRDVITEGDKVRIQRLVYGNFDYIEDDSVLVDYDAICDVFANDHLQPKGEKHISADIALQGRDKFVAIYWKGGVGRIIIDKDKATGREVEQDLKTAMIKYGVHNSNIVGDSDGLGAYLEGYIRNIKAFRGNKRAMNFKDYDNLKSECAWKLAEMINRREIKIICNPKQEEAIKQELAICLKRDNLDSDDQKKKLVKKPQMKRELGRSPDYFDAMMMYAVFHLSRRNGKTFKVTAE